ncbi:hypothetical protein [Propionibacterium sp.]|uniref:hypothetical protein n=1 Tax=Propionibacterium sp. TaxID=1977903 RepID=UPI0039E94567
MPDAVIESLRLTSVLNAMAAGLLSAPQAEAQLRTTETGASGRPHHVVDEQQLLGLPADAGSPVRLALARIVNRMPAERWTLLLPRPGRLGGLRGPVETNQLALECGAVVAARRVGVAWLPRPVGPAMQWQLVWAEAPLPPPTPGEAARALSEQVLVAARELGELDAPAGRRPRCAASVVLGRAYPQACQGLLDKALLWREACQAGLDATSETLHSHAALTRERHLHDLNQLCLDAISAAASWPAEG